MAAAAVTFIAMAHGASATQIDLTPASVIGSTGAYGSGFSASNIFDQQTGQVSDVFSSNYWINPDNGPANASITIDLGSVYQLTSADLFNTHNSNYGDRGTGDFTIIGGNSVVADAGGFILSGPTTTIFSGMLTAAPVSDPISAQTFASLSTGDYRYLEFLPTSVATANNPCCGANVYGLNELRLSGNAAVSAAPEPGTWALMFGGLAMIGGMLRIANARRRENEVAGIATA